MSVPFEDWIQGSTIYIGWDRYSTFGGGFVAASCYVDDDKLRESVEDLEGGDNDMFAARDHIDRLVKNGEAWIGSGQLPSDAVLSLEKLMRDYHRSIS